MQYVHHVACDDVAMTVHILVFKIKRTSAQVIDFDAPATPVYHRIEKYFGVLTGKKSCRRL